MQNKDFYESPVVEVMEVNVESGFANSNGTGESGNEVEW